MFLTAGLPYPPDADGGRRKLFHLLQHLARDHEILLVYLEAPFRRAAEGEVAALRSQIPVRLARIEIETPDFAGGKIPEVPLWSRYWSRKSGEELNSLCRQFAPDVVHIDKPACAWYIPYLQHPAVALAPNDCLRLQERRRLQSLPRFSRARLRAWREGRKLIAYEKRAYLPAQERIFVSEDDAVTYMRGSPDSSAVAIAFGVDTEYFAPPPDCPPGQATILFYGTMDFLPNIQGATRLATRIWPQVRASVPEAHLILAGRDPEPEVQDLHDPRAGIEVTGTVADIRPYLARATLFVAPLISGGGMKTKILEAMAMGVPIIASKLGTAGIAEADKVCRICERDEEFIAAIEELLVDPAGRQRMIHAGHRLVRDRYSWQRCAADHVEVYRRLAGV